jgi:hypothetical protein
MAEMSSGALTTKLLLLESTAVNSCQQRRAAKHPAEGFTCPSRFYAQSDEVDAIQGLGILESYSLN